MRFWIALFLCLTMSVQGIAATIAVSKSCAMQAEHSASQNLHSAHMAAMDQDCCPEEGDGLHSCQSDLACGMATLTLPMSQQALPSHADGLDWQQGRLIAILSFSPANIWRPPSL